MKNSTITPTTLCTGCGHNSVSKWISDFIKTQDIPSSQIVKIGGIGCSSKTINYCIDGAFGVYSIHGRASCVASGVSRSRGDLKTLVISGDGDSLNIGLSHFIHAIRRNDPVIYILENNGVYGLTKGQPSAGNDIASPVKNKFSPETVDQPIDPSLLALMHGAPFVGRAFSGDKKQFTELLRLAWKVKGFCLIEALSPCVAYGNLPQATKSFNHIKENNEILNQINCVYEAQDTENKDGSSWQFSIDQTTYTLTNTQAIDVTDPKKAFRVLDEGRSEKKIYTGLFHINEKALNKTQGLNLSELPEKELKLSGPSLDEIQKTFLV